MNILLTCNHYFGDTGSEIFLNTIRDFLERKGHDVTLYARFSEENSELKKSNYDIAYCIHNISAMEVRFNFPKLPIVFLSNGVLPFLERPPFINIKPSIYLAVTEEVCDFLRMFGVNNIKIFRNLVDGKKFFPQNQIRDIPERVLILSNRITDEKANIIRKMCENLDLDYKFVGSRYGSITQEELPSLINEADIVFSLGRGVIETMMCGRIPIVFDYNGGDGLVTLENVKDFMKCNFSGRVMKKNFTVKELTEEINKYNSKEAEKLRDFAVETFDAEKGIDKLINLFEHLVTVKVENIDVNDFIMLDNFISSINEVTYYSKLVEKV